MATRGALEQKVRQSGLLSLLGSEANDAEIADFFVDSIVDGLVGIKNINQASQVSGIITDFLSDYDITVSDKGSLDGTVSRLAQDYLSSAKSEPGKNAPKGKQAQALPAKKKGGKQKGKKDDDDEDDAEDEIAKVSKTEKAKATQSGNKAAKKDSKPQPKKQIVQDDEDNEEDEDEEEEEEEEKPVGGKKGAAKKAENLKKQAAKKLAEENEEEDEDEEEEDEEEEEEETPKGKKGGAAPKKGDNKKGGKKGGKNVEEEEEEEEVKGKGGKKGKKGGKGKGEPEEEDEAPKGKGKGKKGKQVDDDEEEVKGKGKGKKGKQVDEEEEEEVKGKGKGKKGKQVEEDEEEVKGKGKGAKGKGKQQAQEDEEEEEVKGKGKGGKKGGKGKGEELEEKPAAKGKGGKKAAEEEEEEQVKPAAKGQQGKKGGKGKGEEAEEEKPVAAKGQQANKKGGKGKGEDVEEEKAVGKGKGAQKGAPAEKGKGGQAPVKGAKQGAGKPVPGKQAADEDSDEEKEKVKRGKGPKGMDNLSKKGGLAALAEEEDYDEDEDEEEEESEQEEEEEEEEEEDNDEAEKEAERKRKEEEEERIKKEKEEEERKKKEEEERLKKEEEERKKKEEEEANKPKESRKDRKKREKTEAKDKAEQEEKDLLMKGKPQEEVTVDFLDAERKGADSMSKDIHVEKFDINFPGKVLFKDASLHLIHGHKYGLVAPNGSGKSTLLKAIADRENEFIAIPKHFDITYVEQEVTGDDTPAIESVILADVERTALLKLEKQLMESDDPSSGDRLVQVHSRLDDIEAYSAEARASSILSGLQFTEEMKRMATKDFSGGWRMRIALARALFRRPTLLLLDEPTNHLDLMAVIWLETYILRWKNTLLIVSHDQGFLNSVCTDMIHIYQTKLDYYRGNYDSFKHAFTESVSQARKAFEKQQKLLKAAKEQKGKKDEKSKAVKKAREDTKVLRNRQIKAGKGTKDEDTSNKPLDVIARPPRDYNVIFEFPDPEELSPPIIQVNDASFFYNPEKPIFRDLNFGIDMESRIALVGPNGAGKSTLIKLLTGELQPTEGSIARNRKCIFGRFTQHFVDKLDMTKTPVEYLQSQFPEYKPDELRPKLGRFGLTGMTHLQPIKLLSGGQKSRVVMTDICMRNPHILFLDEPTNHLDIESVDALAEALNDFKGGVILVSHDARLIQQVCSDIWIVGNNTVTIYDGAFEDYREELIQQFEEREEREEEARRQKDEERRKKRDEEMKEREKKHAAATNKNN